MLPLFHFEVKLVGTDIHVLYIALKSLSYDTIKLIVIN